MTNPLQEAQAAIHKARQALSDGDRKGARQWAERASKLAPQLEDPWLILAAVADPQVGLEYLKRALRINPDSPRARKGMQWALERLRQPPPEPAATAPKALARRGRKRAPAPAGTGTATPPAARRRRSPVLAIFLVVLGLGLVGGAGWTAANSPEVLARLVRPILAALPTQAAQPPQWARVDLPKPTYTASARIAQPLPTATPPVRATATSRPALPTASPEFPTVMPTDSPWAAPSQVAAPPQAPTTEPAWSGTITMEYVPDGSAALPPEYAPPDYWSPDYAPPGYAPPDYTPPDYMPPEYAPPPPAPASPQDAASGENWIDVDLTRQMLYAYTGETLVNSFRVSTGTWQTPTITGRYNIWVKFPVADMSGPDYYLPDVPHVMYFSGDYGIHGTYWHNNFGTPMSHGCVNMSLPDAAWLYDFASVGTVVNVHY